MKNAAIIIGLVLFTSAGVSAQRIGATAAAGPKPVIFAVLNDGKSVEPIAFVDGNTLTQTVDGGSEQDAVGAFHKAYYRVGGKYRLIFGGADAGNVSIKSSDPGAECARNAAEITFVSERARLRGNVMALATNVPTTKKGSGVRRLPTAAERSEIEALVRSFLAGQRMNAAVVKDLKYHNLTAVDVDSDGKVELIGTFWVEPTRTSRALLFFIAEKGSDGKYSFGHTDFRVIEQKDVMSEEITDLDDGVYHERLLDLFDFDNNGTAEIFTYIQSFEGAGFNAYRREKGKWNLIFEGSNYRCAY